MIAITRDSVVVRAQELPSADLSGEIVMLNVARGHYHALNQVASETWALMHQPVSVDTICRQLECEYDVAPAECERAVLTFLSELAQNGLISTT